MSERLIEFRVPADVRGARADKVLAAGFDDISRGRLQKAFALGCVTFEGVVIDQRFKLTGPGLLRASLDEPDPEAGPAAVAMDLNIVHEDASIIVLNKAAGMVVHPGSGTGENTLVHALLHHCKGVLSTVGAPDRPGIVHRLDKETSGLIVVAKTDRAHHRLAAAFSGRETYKRYVALVCGMPKRRSGTCEEPIGRHRVARTRMAVSAQGRPAHTDWALETAFGNYAAQLSCRIHTGRTHQIRVHMSHLGHPILGDTTYGFKSNRLKSIQIPRILLHAAELRLPHPDGEETMTFQAPLPEDFQKVVEAPKHTGQGNCPRMGFSFLFIRGTVH